MYLLDDCKAPSYSTISRFMVKCTPIIQDIFNEIFSYNNDKKQYRF